ncbi:ABC transporter substrate-binding protein [Clostridium rectalis]|uniref:ABC transporter substrate-binding protein n=1 Tax=Clostridium rectalis TaxID=2040295 RepID=UPI000F62F784|nr:ABC transporter substrate-binding protein [Clostridium rectalis]
MKKFISFFIIIFLFVNGCVEKKVSNNKIKRESNSIIYGTIKNTTTLNMFDDSQQKDEELQQALFDGLVKKDSRGNIIPSLAEKFENNKDHTVYKFKIRNNAKWSNGEEITAEDFKVFFSQIMAKDFINSFDYELFCIFGLENYRKGLKDFSNVAIKDLDKHTLEIRLNYPCSYFLDIISNPRYSLRDINDNLYQWEKNFKNIKFSGAYKILQINNKNIVLKKNDNYWGKAQVYNDIIEVTKYNNSEELMAAFKAQKIDIFKDPLINEISRLINNNEIYQQEINYTKALIFNSKRSNLADLRFKKDINQSIDRKKICTDVLNSTAIPIEVKYKEDAKTGSLERRDYSNKKITLIYLNNSEDKRVCEKIALDLKKIKNFNVELLGCSNDEFNKKLNKNNYDMALVELKKDSSREYYLNKYSSKNPLNICNFRSLEYDALLYKAKLEKDKSKKGNILNKCEEILKEEFPVLELYKKKLYISKIKDVDLETNYYGDLLLDKIRFEQL